MDKVAIPWDDGSGNHLYLDFSKMVQNSESYVTSDANLTGLERRKTIIFSAGKADEAALPQEAYLTIVQRTDSLIVASLSGIVGAIDGIKAGWAEATEDL